ncbi:mitochondrial genome maintenance MGM101 [Nemania sp. NC0429]|nr:mitochondrial genome maintenance MGM101 [Nemania sp. NC0429]
MASRTMSPLRAAASRGMSLTPITPTLRSQCVAAAAAARRGVVTASKARAYPQSSIPSSAETTATKTTTTRTPTPPRSYVRTAATTTTSAASRKRIPAVSGEPLPDAPTTPAPATTSPGQADYGASISNGNGNGSGNGIDSGSGDGAAQIDWTRSYHGLGTSAFPPETAAILQAPIDPDDIEVKPDGIIYLPEIKYRRILNTAFGPGGWGLAPRGELMVQDRLVTREYALVVHGRFVGQARGEQQYFNDDGVSTAAEGCKSNALVRCCKDLGIASELWDPRFIRKFMKENAVQQWVEHVVTKKKKQIWLRKDDEVRYPFKKSTY